MSPGGQGTECSARKVPLKGRKDDFKLNAPVAHITKKCNFKLNLVSDSASVCRALNADSILNST